MPSIVGPVKISSVSNAGVANFGDSFNLSPKNAAKTYGGSGSFPTGDLQITNNFASSTNVLDSDGTDETIVTAN